MHEREWYTLTPEEAVKVLQSNSLHGLTSQEAEKRLAKFGPNALKGGQKISPLQLFLAQFKDLMVLVLLGATSISFFLGEIADAITIIAIVIINAVLGFIQEYRAEKSLASLQKMAAPEARVIRDGELRQIPASEVVPGDILILEAGDRVAADGLLLEAVNLQAEEAALTGESLPVGKRTGALEGQVPLGDRRNMVFSGTSITRGRGRAVVVATGMSTEMGKIAGLLGEVKKEETPLQQRLDYLGKWLVGGCLAVCLTLAIAGIWKGEEPYHMFLAGVSLAVAAIPEGLPAIVTVCLALGVQRMAQRQAIIRRLPAVETLGCATVICSDKTGTLTQNQMTVRQLYVNNCQIEVSGTGFSPQGDFTVEGRRMAKDEEHLKLLLTIASQCNNAVLQRRGLSIGGWLRGPRREVQWQISGDPTEGALLVAAAKAGIWREHLAREEPRAAEIPFEPERKRMTVICSRRGGFRAYVKGAPDVILELCTGIWLNSRVQPLTPELRQKIMLQNQAMAEKALRVLALSFRDLPADHPLTEAEVERELVFVGLAGMIDPPRPEAVAAIRTCRQAGIKVVMITGDHQVTAQAVGSELGMETGEGRVLNGRQLDNLNDSELASLADKVNIYARVAPQHKLRIVRALKSRGQIVAMTGDGVNDAPAVKEANIGIAMGRSGTEVTKEAAAMILADDNFATIVAAVEEGRVIYANIRKFIRYLLSCNIGEVMVMFLAVVIGLPLPLLPIQILWMNLVTDGLPAMALAVDRKEPGVMQRPPYRPDEGIFARGLGWRIISLGIQIGLATLLVFIGGLILGEGDEVTARTLAFTTLVMAQLFAVFECRSEYESPFAVGYFSNPYLVAAVASSAVMQLATLYFPPLQGVFKTVPLNPFHWAMVLVAAGWRTLWLALSYYLVLPVRRLVWDRS
ncbi:MAG: P-type Ca2+ transporter type [Clostridia bacterium]|nr:P-type Ca2+ transporter type [Clostridia bacterium]